MTPAVHRLSLLARVADVEAWDTAYAPSFEAIGLLEKAGFITVSRFEGIESTVWYVSTEAGRAKIEALAKALDE